MSYSYRNHLSDEKKIACFTLYLGWMVYCCVCILYYADLHWIWGQPQFQYYTEYNENEIAATPNDKNTESRFINLVYSCCYFVNRVVALTLYIILLILELMAENSENHKR